MDKKRIIFITQSKGGSGKSLLAFMLAEKYKQAVILDLDDATGTTQLQLAYRKPIKVSFLDEQSKSIDRVAFNNLFRSITEKKESLFIADLGASVAEQLHNYFNAYGVELIVKLLQATGIELEIVCVVNGANHFVQTSKNLLELVDSTKGKLKVTVAYNQHFPFNGDQEKEMKKIVADHALTFFAFDLAQDRTPMSLRIVENVLRAGKGIEGLDPFTAMYFETPIKELPL